MGVATIRRPRLCSSENHTPPRREKMPLWNIETLHVHHSFISNSFTKSRLPTVKYRPASKQSMPFGYGHVSRPGCACDAQQGLCVRAAFLQTSYAEKLSIVDRNRPLVEIEEFPTVRLDIRLRAFDLPALSAPASHFRPGPSLQAGVFEPRVRFCALSIVR